MDQSLLNDNELELSDEDGERSASNVLFVPQRSFLYIIVLTTAIGGLQLSWCAEFSNGTPFLLSLGMSKTLMSLVWIAGPLSGTIGQPIVGVLSDELRWSYGRRRPFMLVGGLATIISLLCLSWSKGIVDIFTGHSLTESELKSATIPFAVFWVYALDFSISAVQAASRAFIVDNVPTNQQQIANAWAARLTGVGNIVGYYLGSINLSRLLPFLGNTQFRALSACAALALAFTVVPAAMYIEEKDPNNDPVIQERDHLALVSAELDSNNSLLAPLGRIFSETVRCITHLSPQTRLACNIQFFAWMGYFPMLFYTTTYVGKMYINEFYSNRPANSPSLSQPDLDELGEEATRQGTQALLIYSFVSLAANAILPYLVRGRSTVGKIWLSSHAIFAFAMSSTFFITTTHGAKVLVALLGIPWAVSLWAPFTIIAEEISRLKDQKEDYMATIPHSDSVPRFFSYEHESGAVLGVHNVYVAAPQMVSSLVASILFKIYGDDDTSLAWVFRFGGLAALVAFYLNLFIKTPKQLVLEEARQSLESGDPDAAV